MTAPRRKPAHHSNDRIYHVVPHAERWWVEREDGTCEHASASEQDAIAWAIRAAEHDHAQGRDVIVCVVRNGGWRTAWHSPPMIVSVQSFFRKTP